jgi:hypothetical protein
VSTLADNAVGPGTWNRDGVIVFYPGENQPLYRISAMSGEARALTKLDQSRQENSHLFPQFLPDGRHFIYTALSTKPENRAIYLGSLDSPQVKRIHDGYVDALFAPGYLVFTSPKRRRFSCRLAKRCGSR